MRKFVVRYGGGGRFARGRFAPCYSKRRLIWPPKRMESSNQKRLPPDARADCDVLSLPLKLNVRQCPAIHTNYS